MDESLRRYYLKQIGIPCWLPVNDAGDDQAVSPLQPGAVEAGSEQLGSEQAGSVQGVAELAATEQTATEQAADTASPVNTAIAQEATQSISQAVHSCTACVLHRHRKQAIPGQGSEQARLLVLLAHPLAADDEENSLCAGPAGELLHKMLSAIGLQAGEFYLTSLLKCAVPGKHTITPAEISACRQHLDRQLDHIQPANMLIMGELASQCYFQKNLSLDNLREQVNAGNDRSLSMLNNTRLMVSYSPHELIAQPAAKRKAWDDLQQLQQRLQQQLAD